MKIELLYFDGCPSYLLARERLEVVLAERGVNTAVDMVRVTSDLQAQTLRFPGSPTIRVDGRDLFPAEEAEGALGCRVYAAPDGLSGAPTVDMIREAIARVGGTTQDS